MEHRFYRRENDGLVLFILKKYAGEETGSGKPGRYSMEIHADERHKWEEITDACFSKGNGKVFIISVRSRRQSPEFHSLTEITPDPWRIEHVKIYFFSPFNLIDIERNTEAVSL